MCRAGEKYVHAGERRGDFRYDEQVWSCHNLVDGARGVEERRGSVNVSQM